MAKLTERRKADRAKMADMLVAAMIAAGAKAEIDLEWGGSREIMVKIEAPGGARIWVDFDGDTTQPDVHVATWNGPFLNPSYLGDVNPHHYGKVNRVGYGIDDLIALLTRDVGLFVSGLGYLSHDDPRIVAMRERYAANGWGWPFEQSTSHPHAIAA